MQEKNTDFSIFILDAKSHFCCNVLNPRIQILRQMDECKSHVQRHLRNQSSLCLKSTVISLAGCKYLALLQILLMIQYLHISSQPDIDPHLCFKEAREVQAFVSVADRRLCCSASCAYKKRIFQVITLVCCTQQFVVLLLVSFVVNCPKSNCF